MNKKLKLNLKFTLEDLINQFTLHEISKNELGTPVEQISDKILDENGELKLNKIEKYVEKYINVKIHESVTKKNWTDKQWIVDDMDYNFDLSWDIKVKSIKKRDIKKSNTEKSKSTFEKILTYFGLSYNS
jgi:Asp-tRNA(Asn)/Glu-tRNA(Gln) amidotransferase C subunit